MNQFLTTETLVIELLLNKSAGGYCSVTPAGAPHCCHGAGQPMRGMN
jgi:hypothetical protein